VRSSRTVHKTQEYYNYLFSTLVTHRSRTVALHDALPISQDQGGEQCQQVAAGELAAQRARRMAQHVHAPSPPSSSRTRRPRSSRDRKSTRLNSSHVKISYAVFCLKNKIINITMHSHYEHT